MPPAFGPSLPVCLRRLAPVSQCASDVRRRRRLWSPAWSGPDTRSARHWVPRCESARRSTLLAASASSARTPWSPPCTDSPPPGSSFGLGRTDGRPREGLHTLSRILSSSHAPPPCCTPAWHRAGLLLAQIGHLLRIKGTRSLAQTSPSRTRSRLSTGVSCHRRRYRRSEARTPLVRLRDFQPGQCLDNAGLLSSHSVISRARWHRRPAALKSDRSLI